MNPDLRLQAVCGCARVYPSVRMGDAMAASTTMTIRISPELKEKLGRLGQVTQRSSSFLAGEAVSAYVARQMEIVEGIQRGLDDVAAGQVVPHDQAMAELFSAIEAVGQDEG